MTKSSSIPGKVWLVGAGPGDPDLLTIKAHRAIEQADLILFDHLISREIRALFPKAVPAFYVGKQKGLHSLTQGELNALMIRQARAGKNVCRLKCGDPFVFGRGAEELLALGEAGIEAEVVPGITAAAGCTSAALVPLTHRGLSQGCTFITGHAERDLTINWSALANLGHTLVFYMGVSAAGMIQRNLLKNGMTGTIPVALIENGCRPEQRVVVGCLHELEELVNRHGVHSPALIVVGDTITLHETLNAVQTRQSSGCDAELQQRLTA